MKKIIFNTQIILLLFFSVFFKSQDNSISASVSTPVAYQTGVPDISFPLVSLPAAKDFTLNFGLTYNPNSYKPAEYCGQIARNWMLSGSNFTITRKVISDYIDESNPDWVEWDDIYYYNLNGEQGSFKFEKSGVFPNDLHIKKLTPSNLIINAERKVTNFIWQDRPVNLFKITDSKGYQYVFEDHDSQKITVAGAGNSQPTYEMRNTFYVSNIKDAANKSIAVFNNKKYIKYGANGSSIIDATVCLPESITTDYGSIIIAHGDSGEVWDFHDRYYFKSFTLIDHNGNFISKNELNIANSNYSFFDIDLFQSVEAQTIQVRILIDIKKLDKNSNLIDSTKFSYTNSPPAPQSWGSYVPEGAYEKWTFLMHGLIKEILPSSGGKIEYKFDFHTIKLENPINYNTQYYINQIKSVDDDGIAPFSYKKKTDSIAFDSHITKKYYLNSLQKSPKSRVQIKFIRNEIYPYGGNPENPWKGEPPMPDPKLAYKVKNDTTASYIITPEIETLYSPNSYIVPSNGTQYLELTGSGGNGWFEIYEKFWTEPPYNVLNQNGTSETGVKIVQIKYYDKSQNYSSVNNGYFSLYKTINFNYDLFNEPGVSSGVSIPDYWNEIILYKNIKVTESNQKGYTKYYFKTPHDFPKLSHPTISQAFVWPNITITNKGLLDKVEIYNETDIKKFTKNLDYTLPAYDPTKIYYYGEGYGTGAIYSHDSFPEKVTTDETSIDSQGNTLTATTEKSFNQDNNNLIKDKKTTADGIIIETDYKYAAEKPNTKLLGAGMISVPLEVTQTQNGNVIGKVETFYDHAGNFFPSAVKSYGINNVLINEEKNDIYDTMGNVLESSSKTGIPTAYIYGYNSTLLLAKIVGAKYSEVMTVFGQPATIEAYKNLEIYTKSNLDIDDSSEEILRQKLDEFRLKTAFKNYQITTYTYDPLIGIKSVTSPSGNKEYYYYDDANRMIRVEDINHNIIKENKYKQNLIN